MRISHAIDDMDTYTRLNDGIFQVIEFSKIDDQTLKQAQEIIRMINRREIYKFVGEAKPERKVEQSEAVQIAEAIVGLSENQLNKEEIVVHVVNFDYGKKDENPIDDMYFYSKSIQWKCVRGRNIKKVSAILSGIFQEQRIRLYCKKRVNELVASAADCFEKFCENQANQMELLSLDNVLREHAIFMARP